MSVIVKAPSTLTQQTSTSSENLTFSKEGDTEKLTSTETNDDAYPGLRAWRTVVGAWFVLFATFGYLYSFGVYQDFYTRSFLAGHTPSNIAWIASFQLMAPFTFGLVSGPLFDAGYFHALEIFGSILFTFSLFMLSLAKPHNYYQVFLSQGLGMGLGLGCIFVPTISVVANHFQNKHRALATGIVLSGSSVGAMVFPIMLNHLIPSVGFAAAVRGSGYLVAACLLIGNSLMMTAPFSHKGPRPDIKSFFRDPGYVVSIFGAFIGYFGFYFPMIYLQVFATQHHVDLSLAFYSLAILNGASGFGRVIANLLADIYGPFNVLIPCTVITGGMIWAVLGIHDTHSLIAVSILYGFFSGAWLSVAVVGLASLSRSPQEAGARQGLALAIISLASLASGPIQGALLTDTFDSWVRPIAFSGTIVITSAIFYVMTRIILVKERNTHKV